MVQHTRRNTEIRTLIVVAKVISMLFRPIYYPVLCCTVLFTTYPLVRLPWQYKLWVLSIMALFTIALPITLASFYRRLRNIGRQEMRKRANRIVPYLLTIMCYACYLLLMHNTYMPYLLVSVIIVALFLQVVCTVLSLVWKVSVHAAGAGAIIGAIAAYSQFFQFNPLLWMSLAIIVAGMVGTSRMILRQHGLAQILVGTLIGIVCGYYGIAWGVLIYGG